MLNLVLFRICFRHTRVVRNNDVRCIPALGTLFNDDQHIEAISFAYPGPDADFLKEIGFYEIVSKDARDQMPVVYKTFTKAEILTMSNRWSNKNVKFVTELDDIAFYQGILFNLSLSACSYCVVCL